MQMRCMIWATMLPSGQKVGDIKVDSVCDLGPDVTF